MANTTNSPNCTNSTLSVVTVRCQVMRPTYEDVVVVIPQGYRYITHCRTPKVGETYLLLDDELHLVKNADTAEQVVFCRQAGQPAGHPADRYIIVMRKTRKVYEFRETNQFRRAEAGEWYIDGEAGYRAFMQGPTMYPARIVAFEQTEEQN